MNSTKKQISKNRIKLSITVPADKMSEHFEAEYGRFAPTVTIQGFRAGKAPKAMIIEQIGHGRLSQAAIEAGLNISFREALHEHGLNPVTEPAISVSKHPSFLEGSEDDLIFEAEFDILPEAKIGDWKKIKIKKIDEKKLEVNDEEIEKIIKYLRRQAAKLTDVERAVKSGDWVMISFEGSIAHVKLDKLTSKSFPMVIGETQMIPGFEEQLIGLKKGEKKEFDLTFPKDFQDKEFVLKKVHFSVEIEDVKEVELPKIDSEFLQKFGHKDEKALRKAIGESLKGEKQMKENQSLQDEISREIIKLTKVDLPNSLVEREAQRMKAQLLNDLTKRGGTYEKYLEGLGISTEKADKDFTEQARNNILLGVGLGQIAKLEKIELKEGEGLKKVYDHIIELCSR